MKKIYYLVLFATLLSVAANAQTNWVTQKLDEKVSVKFPVQPQKVTKNDIDSYTVKGPDSIGYNAVMIDFKTVAKLDSVALAPMKDSQRFADGLKAGMASKKPNYTFGDAVIGKWKTYTTYTIPGTENTNKNQLLTRMILIGSKLYTLTCVVPANTITKNNDLFLSSAELLK